MYENLLFLFCAVHLCCREKMGLAFNSIVFNLGRLTFEARLSPKKLS